MLRSSVAWIADEGASMKLTARNRGFLWAVALTGVAFGSACGDEPYYGDVGRRGGQSCISVDECDEGEKSCSAGAQRYCEQQTDGCYRWSTPQFCQNGQVCMGNACGACQRHYDCSKVDVCLTGRCEAASGREYQFKILNAKIPERRPDGTTWDPLGGAPDPWVKLVIDGNTVGSTKTRSDTFSPVWNESLPWARVYENSRVELFLYDEDPDGHERIDSVYLLGPIDFMRTGLQNGRLHSKSAVDLAWEMRAR